MLFVKYLSKNAAGGKIDAQDCFGNVPLFYAVVGGCVEAVKVLLEKRASP